MSVLGLDSGTPSGKRGIFDPIPRLALTWIHYCCPTKDWCYGASLLRSNNWGHQWLSGRPYKAAQARSFTVKEPSCVLWSLAFKDFFFFFFFNSFHNFHYQLQKDVTLPVLNCANVGHPIFVRTLCKLTLLWQGSLRSPHPDFFVSQDKLNG